jgi:predicted enzyme related to lactoylglutathione lyase
MTKGTITHIEFPADDVEAAKRFYGAVAGWEFGATEGFQDYWTFRSEEGHGGAIGKRDVSAPHDVRVYVTVPKLEEAISAAEANGGSVCQPATEIPGMGRYAAVHDPDGNEVGLWEDTQAG